MRFCLDCKVNISKRHLNAKRCKRCGAKKKKNPDHNLTKLEQEKAIKLAGKMYVHHVAKAVGVSLSNLKRFAKTRPDINWNAHAYKEKDIEKVIDYYLCHTLEETKKKFPGIAVRSIIDRYCKRKKVLKWSDEDIVNLYRWTGLCQWDAIAKKLGRNPYAVRKRRRFTKGRLNSLPFNTAKHYVKKGCPFYHVRLESKAAGTWICPWIIMEKYLKDDIPDWIRDSIVALAKFQRWLHGSEERVFEILQENL